MHSEQEKLSRTPMSPPAEDGSEGATVPSPRAERAPGKAERAAPAAAPPAAASEEGDERLKRLAAEFANYKKRVEKDRAALEERVTNERLAEILPLFDDFHRLLEHAEENAGLLQGIRTIDRKWLQWQKMLGIERIEALNAPFDPHYHEAVLRRPVGDPGADGKVLQVLENGYVRNGSVLRHARVIVGHYEMAPDKDTVSPVAAGGDEQPQRRSGSAGVR